MARLWLLSALLALLGTLLIPLTVGAATTEDVVWQAGAGNATAPVVVTGNNTHVTGTTYLLRGNITDTGNTTIDQRGFVYDTVCAADPGNATAPAASAWSFNEMAAGNWNATGVYSDTVSGLAAATTYYYRAVVHNTAGYWDYGDSCGNFTTLGTIYPPTNFTVTQIGIDTANATWTTGVGASETYIRVNIGSAPTDRTEGYLFYVGNGTWADDSGLALEVSEYCYSAWGFDGNATYSDDYVSDCVGGAGMTALGIGVTSLGLIIAALGLTIAMFVTRNQLLGFPCLIFWAILGGYFYQQSTTTWDIEYLLFFASMGMAIFCGYAAFALRKSDLSGPDADKGAFFDEGGSGKGAGGGGGFMEKPDSDKYIDEDDGFGDRSKPSIRTLELRARAKRRRGGEGVQKKPSWGEFK